MKISEKKFQEICYKLLKKIKGDYSGILCPLKGGFPLAYFFNRKLNLPISYIEISSYEGKEQKQIKVGPTYSNMNLKGHYLVCDDIYDTGRTIEFLKKFYSKCSFDIAVLISKQKLDNIHYGELVNSDIWVEFWWENF